jgi:RecA/RadA recombinase
LYLHVRLSFFPVGTSALDLMRLQASLKPIPSLCAGLDQLCAGGVPVGQITEFCGIPGCQPHTKHRQQAVARAAAIPAAAKNATPADVRVDFGVTLSFSLLTGGKTQLCIQLACNVQIPKRFNGAWEGEAIYIGQWTR